MTRTYRPFYAVWEVTLQCDQACHHCGSRAGQARRDELSTAECRNLVDQLADLGVKEVTLIGGEAYLRDDWLEIIRTVTARGMLATLTTGGAGMTLARARSARDAGLSGVSVSIDGNPGTHDRVRGRVGSHRRACDALACLSAAGIATAVNTQINRLSMPELPSIFEILVSVGVTSWQVQLTTPMGRAADNPDMLLQPHELLQLFPLLNDLARRCRDGGVDLVCGNDVGYFGPYDAVLRGKTPSGHSTTCGAGNFTIGIEADGTIKACPSLATEAWNGGNVRSRPLREIWEASRELRYVRERTRADLWGFCADCYYAEPCLGGCTWMADSLLGRPGNNPYCHHRALELHARGRRERVERIAPAPGKPFDRAKFALIEEPLPVERSL